MTYRGGQRKHRRFSSRDANHKEIVDVFLAVGWSVVDLSAAGQGVPDILVGGQLRGGDDAGRRVNVLVEIKTEDGALRGGQQEFIEAWRGVPVVVVRNRDDVFRLVGMMEPGGLLGGGLGEEERDD